MAIAKKSPAAARRKDADTALEARIAARKTPKVEVAVESAPFVTDTQVVEAEIVPVPTKPKRIAKPRTPKSTVPANEALTAMVDKVKDKALAAAAKAHKKELGTLIKAHKQTVKALKLDYKKATKARLADLKKSKLQAAKDGFAKGYQKGTIAGTKQSTKNILAALRSR